MRNLYLENLMKFVAKARPVVASITVFAYVNAFVLPITAASANPGKDGEEQDIRKANPRTPQQTEQEQVAFKVTPTSQKQVDFINKVNTLFGYVEDVKSSEAPQQKTALSLKPV